jgi:hypothetical protein
LSAHNLINFPILKKSIVCLTFVFFKTPFNEESEITSFILPSPDARNPTKFPLSSTTAPPLLPGRLLAEV